MNKNTVDNHTSSFVIARPLDIVLFIHSRFDHYAKLHDVQTLAMLACVFQEHCLQFDQKSKEYFSAHSNGHSNNSHMTTVNRAGMSTSPTKRFHGQAPPTPTPTHPVAPERTTWYVSSLSSPTAPVTSPISGSWQEVSESDLIFHELEDTGVEEQTIHEAKCR